MSASCTRTVFDQDFERCAVMRCEPAYASFLACFVAGETFPGSPWATNRFTAAACSPTHTTYDPMSGSSIRHVTCEGRKERFASFKCGWCWARNPRAAPRLTTIIGSTQSKVMCRGQLDATGFCEIPGRAVISTPKEKREGKPWFRPPQPFAVTATATKPIGSQRHCKTYRESRGSRGRLARCPAATASSRRSGIR